MEEKVTASRGHVKTEFKTGGLWPQAEDCPEPPEVGEGGGGGGLLPKRFQRGLMRLTP